MAFVNISKKRKFVADGVFYSELNEVRFYSSIWNFGLDSLISLVVCPSTCRGWLCRSWSPCHCCPHWNYYQGHQNPGCSWWKGSKNSWIDLCCSEEVVACSVPFNFPSNAEMQYLDSISQKVLLKSLQRELPLVVWMLKLKQSLLSTSFLVALQFVVLATVFYASLWNLVRREPRSLFLVRFVVKELSPRSSLTVTWSRPVKLTSK